MDSIVLYKNKTDCCNCGACENICPKKAITMIQDNEGFYYPEINTDLCIKCGLCIKTCPMKKHKAEAIQESRKSHVRIINFSTENNYGALLAGICLENTIRTIVSDNTVVESINYNRKASFPTYKTQIKKELNIWADLFKIILAKFHLYKQVTIENNTKTISNYSYKKIHRYNKFRALFLNQTSESDDLNLKESTDNISALVCGSDVIWHPNIISSGTSKAFYLNFGDDSTRRIAYAPSLDFQDGKELRKYKSYYKKELKNFDFISVREKDNVNFIQSVTKKKVQQCCDPVFLYKSEDFEEMMSVSEESVPEEKYIYAYILRKNDYAVEYVKKLAQEKNLKICFYAEEYDDFGDNAVNCFSDGPAEFLQRLKNAEYVITTSFHCVAFSLIFQKQFLSFTRSETGNKIPDILETFGVTDRQVDNGCIKDIDEPINYKEVEEKINALSEESLDYLRNALKNI